MCRTWFFGRSCLVVGFDDRLTMAKLFDLAHTSIMHQQQADAKGRKEAAKVAA